MTRSYTSFSQAAQEVSDSRVYAGIHWRFDVQAGAAIGNQVGNYIVSNLLLPVSESDDQGDNSNSGGSVQQEAIRVSGREVVSGMGSDLGSAVRASSSSLTAPLAAYGGSVSPHPQTDGLSGIPNGNETPVPSAREAPRSIMASRHVRALNQVFSGRSDGALANPFDDDGHTAWDE